MGTVLILVVVGVGILAAGFLIGRYYIPDDRLLKRQARRARSYIRTVNHLVQDDRDVAVGTAIDELRELVRSENVEDVEPYVALGALFRLQGEWERAIRVHQAIAIRGGLSRELRLRVSYELGLDFQCAGMPRKATRALEACVQQDARHQGALQALGYLYEEQGRYAEAADALRRLARLRDEDVPERHHHLLVAAAQRALQAGAEDVARKLLREAGREHESTHALVAAAELAAARGNFKGASARLEQALVAAPGLARVLLTGLVTAQRELARVELKKAQRAGKAGGDEDEAFHAELEERAARGAVAVLERVLEATGPTGHVEMALAEVRSLYDPSAALADYERVSEELSTYLPARVAAARLALASGDAELVQGALKALAGADGAVAWAMDGAFRCGHCGQRSEHFFWHCAHCRAWGTVRMDVGRDTLDVPPPTLPRVRRESARGGVDVALLGAAAERALPEPSLDSGLGTDAIALGARSPSVLGRVGGWFASAWSGLRGAPKSPALSAALPERPGDTAPPAATRLLPASDAEDEPEPAALADPAAPAASPAAAAALAEPAASPAAPAASPAAAAPGPPDEAVIAADAARQPDTGQERP